jgi:mono/diheme cytochrome c family protein
MQAVNGPRMKALGVALLGTALLAAFSGCDAKENADTAQGRDLFISNCGTCHALKEAATTAAVGPNLDAAFAGARASGMDQDTIEGVVSAQIAEPRETDPSNPTYMPPKILEGQEANDVATYVASVAGVPGIQPPTAAGGPGGQVFSDNGCGACHTLAAAQSNGNVGPNLDEAIAADSPSFIQTSIVDPSAEIAQGFQDGIMPQDYESSIDPKDLQTLVNFLSTCAGAKITDKTKYAADGSCPGS